MRCPACNADNPAAAVTCAACGGPLRRRRATADDSQTPFAGQADSRDPTALTAYRCAVCVGLGSARC